MLRLYLPPLALGIGLTMPVAALYSLISTSVQQSQLPAESNRIITKNELTLLRYNFFHHTNNDKFSTFLG